MFNKQKKLILNLKILKLLFFSPLLISIPFYFANSDAKAGLEFQWDQDPGYRRLKWFQKEDKRKFRNTIFFFLRPSDRKAGLLKITLKIPKTFDSNLKDKVSLCKVKIGGFEGRTKCINDIPADIEINEDNSSLDIFPYSPILQIKIVTRLFLKKYLILKSLVLSNFILMVSMLKRIALQVI